MIQRTSFFLLILLGIFFYRSLFLFFAQDDFYLLASSRANSFYGFAQFFIPKAETPWYRPLSQYVFYFLTQSIFGFNPFAFHLIVLLTHWITTVLLFLFLYTRLKSFWPSVIGTLFYAMHTAQFLSLSWVAAYGFVLGPLLVLATVLLFYRFLTTFTLKHFVYSLIMYAGSLLTIEIAPVFLPVLVVMVMSQRKRLNWRLKNYVLLALPFLFISAGVMGLRFMAYPPAISGDYQFSYYSVPNVAIFYAKHFIGMAFYTGLASSPLRIFHQASAILLSLFLFVFPLLFAKKILLGLPLFWIGLSFIGFGILPFLFIPLHQSPHYLSFSLFGGAMLVGLGIKNIHQKFSSTVSSVYIGIVALLILITDASGYQIEWQNHWIIKRASLAKTLVEQGIYTAPIGTEAYFALGANYAQEVYRK